MVVLALMSFTGGAAWAGESLVAVTFTDDVRQTRTVEGRIVTEAQDGGVLLQGRDGALWTVTPAQFVKREEREDSFAPLDAKELGRQLLGEFGPEFEIVATRHYVLCTDAGRPYAQWAGSLFERLMAAFHTHWRGLDLHEPEFPLVAVIFRDPKRFAEFAARDAGAGAAAAKGYYSVRTNRIILYDLTAGTAAGPAATVDELNRRLGAATFNVATVVHEATHQIAFNSGLHTRYADVPLWLSEGLAMYFETPDLQNRSGWRTVGRPNPSRLRQFLAAARTDRSPDSLSTLLRTDQRLTDPKTAGDAYAEAWALTYFLIKTRRTQYLDYLKRIGRKRPLIWNTADERSQDFRAAFGDDLPKLDAEFLRYMQRVR